MMTMFGMVFERHSREFPVVNGASLARQALAGNPAIPATTSLVPVVAALRTLRRLGLSMRRSLIAELGDL
jgi:hypothetical protein